MVGCLAGQCDSLVGGLRLGLLVGVPSNSIGKADATPASVSPRPGPRRPLVNVRLSASGLAFLDAEAQRLGITRSDVIREALRRFAALPEAERTVSR